MENKINQKSYTLFIIGAILLVASIVFCIYTYQSSYALSLEKGRQLSQIKKEIATITEGTQAGDLDALNAQKSILSDEKLALERPYSFALTATFLSLLLLAKGLYNAFRGTALQGKVDIQRLAQAGLCAALCYIGFTFFKVDLIIPGSTEKTAFHFGNVFCVLAALLLGGYWGGMAGAVGMTIADLTTSYVTSAPKTFVLKLCIGLIVGLVAHKVFKLTKSHPPKYVLGVTVLSAFCGMLFNVIADPLVGYFYKTYLLGIPQDLALALAKVSTLTTGVNAIVAVIAASLFYTALRPGLKKAGLLVQIPSFGTGELHR